MQPERRVVRGVFSISFEAATDAQSAATFPLRRFIGGKENLLVQAACRDSLRETPQFSPLVFVGPSGTGKSLLGHGLLYQWSLEARDDPSSEGNATGEVLDGGGESRGTEIRAVEITGADFARAYANAVQTDSLEDFRRRFESPRRLLIDDVQGLADKDGAQQELCRLIDLLSERGDLLLATMSTLPADAHGLSNALVSRLSGGLTVPVSPPGPEARREILQQFARLFQHELCDETLSLLSDGTPAPFPTFPDLQHAFSQLMLLSEQRDQPIDPQLARCLLEKEAPEQPSLRTICQLTAKQFQLKVADLRGSSRRQGIVHARSMAMLLCRRLTDASLGQIGKYFGNRDHTTVIHACRQTEKRIADDSVTQSEFTKLFHLLNS